MWYPHSHYNSRAEEIVSSEGVKYSRVTSGYNKGDYTASLVKPGNIEWKELSKYYNEKYGTTFQGFSHLTSKDKEQARRYLIMDISSEISLNNRQKTEQPISEIWQYYKKTNGKIEFTKETIGVGSQSHWEGMIGRARLDYFNILDGTVISENWSKKPYQLADIGGVTNFKELYYKLKFNAKEEHLGENRTLNYKRQYNDRTIETYIFDEQNIPEIKEFEDNLNGVKKQVETKPTKSNIQFFPIDKSVVDKFISKNVPPPSRGSLYTLAQQGEIRSLAYGFDHLDYLRDDEINTIKKHWHDQVYMWQAEMIKMLGKELFGSIFYKKNKFDEGAYINKNDYVVHPFHEIGVSIHFSGDDGITCKYGSCNFSKKEYWSYQNVVSSLKNSIAKVDERLTNVLNETFHKDLYDGSITLTEWVHKYSSVYHSHNKSHVLKKVYNLDSTYSSVNDVIAAYLKNNKEEPVKEVENQDTTKTTKTTFLTTKTTSDLTKYIPTSDNGYIKIGYRSEFLKTPILLGRERVIVLANNEVHRSIFAIVDLENIIASHNEKTYNDTESYPTDSKGGNINDRNYADDKNAQHKVRQVAEQFNPEVQISTSATAAGLPIITIDGVVVSGNNRTMSMKLMVSEFVENYEKYLHKLSEELNYGGYGIEYGSYLNLKNPILVRIDLDFPEYNTMEMSKYNKDTKKVERPIDKAIKLGKILEANPACFNLLSDSISRFDTISDLYSSETEVNKIKTALVSCGILTTNELPAFISNNVFTTAGKEFLENLMAGMILEKDQLIASEMDGVKGLKQIIVQSLTVLVKNEKIDGFSLKAYINDAIMIQQKLVSSKLNIRDLVSQFSLFEDSKFEFTERGCYINLLLHLGKLKFKKTIERYNESADSSGSASMFGEPTTQQELFDNLITKQLDSKDVEFIKDFFSKKRAPKVIEVPEEVVEEVIIETPAEVTAPDYKYGIGDLVSFVGIGGEVFYGNINTLGSRGMYEVNYAKGKSAMKPESELTFISKVEQVEVEKPKVEVVAPPQEQTKEELEALIKGLEIAYEFDPTEDLDTLIKGLKIALEFKD